MLAINLLFRRTVSAINSNKPHYKSICLMLLSYCIFTITMSCAKFLDKNLSIPTIVFVRCVFAYVFFLPMIADRGFAYYKTKRLGLHLLRIVLVSCSMLCTYYTYTNIPLSLATCIGFTGPILVTCFAALLLKEKVEPKQWLAIAFGYAGVLVIIQPVSLVLSHGIITGVLANIFAALAIIAMKNLTKTESEKTILLYANTGILLIVGLMTCFTWTLPSRQSMLLLTVMGALAMLSQYCMVKALKLGKPSTLAPFEYSRLLFAIPIGVLVFGEKIGMWIWLGAGILIASNYYIVVSKNKP